MKKKLLHTILFLTLSLSSVKAQPPQPAVWSLQDCIEYAKANNISINSLRLSQQSTEQDLVLSKASRLPSLSANVSQSVASTSKRLSPASSYGLSSDLMIYNGGYVNNDIAQKQLNVQSAALNVLQQQNDITLQITQAYYNIALAKESLLYIKDLITTSTAQVTRGEELYKAGSIAKKDLLQLQAVLANDQYNLVTAQNTERQYRLSLQQLLQLSSGTAFDIATPDTSAIAMQITSLQEVQQNALATRPEISNSKLGVNIAELDLEKAKAGSRPTISIGAGINTNYNNGTGYSYPKALGTNLYQQVGVTLSIPIFNRKTTQVNVAKAKINIQQANLDAANTRLNLMQQVEQAYLNLVNAQGQYAAAGSQLSYSKEAFRIANEQLRLGSYNITDYLQQRNLYVQALQSYVQARYTTSLYDKVYNFYNGVPVTQ